MFTLTKILSGIALVCLTYVVYVAFSGCDVSDEEKSVNEPQAETTLEKVAMFFRHGERAPEFPTVKYNISSREWPVGLGELTPQGKRHSYLLGKRLRRRYGRILTPFYSKHNLVALSTIVDRTMMSASLILAGMYPPSSHQAWNEKLSWSPIPVHGDNRILLFGTCPRFTYEQLSRRPLQMEHLATFMKAAKNRGIRPIEDDLDAFVVFDTLSSLELDGVETVPRIQEFMDESYPVFAEWWRRVASWNLELKQLCSVLSDYILKFMESKGRVFMYSVHDFNIFSLAGILGTVLPRYPLPTGGLIIELHNINGEKAVKAFYISSFGAQMVPINMSCGNLCSWPEFKKMLQELQPEDYNAVCSTVPRQLHSDSWQKYASFFNVSRIKQLINSMPAP